jgi:hypothetical protein
LGGRSLDGKLFSISPSVAVLLLLSLLDRGGYVRTSMHFHWSCSIGLGPFTIVDGRLVTISFNYYIPERVAKPLGLTLYGSWSTDSR